MLNCAFCEEKTKGNSGLSAHLRSAHPIEWKGSVEQTFEGMPEFDTGISEDTRGKRGKYKRISSPGSRWNRVNKDGRLPAVRRILSKCPWCKFKANSGTGLAGHIKWLHSEHWKGNLDASLGREPAPWRMYPQHKEKKARKEWDRIGQVLKQGEPSKQSSPVLNYCPQCGINLAKYHENI